MDYITYQGKKIRVTNGNLNLSNLEIEDIAEINGLEKLTNLQELFLNKNKIAEIRGLENLINLHWLYLNDNIITKIKGLENLINLQSLYLFNNHITEINGLKNLKNLQLLNLRNNQIIEIDNLQNSNKLEQLYLSANKIAKIRCLENLTNLKHLILSDNQITEIDGLSNLVNLQELSLNTNKILEIRGLENLINLRWLYLSNNLITEIKGLENLTNLKELTLDRNKITEIKSLENLVNLKKLKLKANPIIDEELYLFQKTPKEIVDYCHIKSGNNYYDKGDFNNAIASYNKVIELDLKRPEILGNIGNIYYNKGDFEEAIKYYRKVTNLDPENPEAWVRMGTVFLDKGDLIKATEFFKKALDKDPRYYIGLNNLGKLHFIKGEYNKALEYYEKALNLDPKNAMILNKLGIIYYKKNEFHKAIKSFNDALTIIPEFIEPWINIINTYKKIKKEEKAREYYEFLLQIDPTKTNIWEQKELLISVEEKKQIRFRPPIFIQYYERKKSNEFILKYDKKKMKIVLVQSSIPWDYLFVKSSTSPDYNNYSFTLFTLKEEYRDYVIRYYLDVINKALKSKANFICFPEFIYINDTYLKNKLNKLKQKINIVTGTYINSNSLNTCEMYIKNFENPIIQHKLYPYVAIGEFFRNASQRILHCVKTEYANIITCICIDIISQDIQSAIKNNIGTDNQIDIIFSPSYNKNSYIYDEIRQISEELKACIIFINDANTLVNSKVFLKGREVKLKNLIDSRPDLFYFELNLNDLK